MSGDTSQEIFRMAREQRLPLLSKPVRAARLCAALQHLLSDAREAARDVAEGATTAEEALDSADHPNLPTHAKFV